MYIYYTYNILHPSHIINKQVYIKIRVFVGMCACAYKCVCAWEYKGIEYDYKHTPELKYIYVLHIILFINIYIYRCTPWGF